MQNYEASAKSRGAVIFANNTDTVDYVSIAQVNARLIEKHLSIPTTIITTESTGINQRFDVTDQRFVDWKNFGRSNAMAMSPYDETLLIDADYLILDDSLLKAFDTLGDYLLVDKNRYVTDLDLQETMGIYSLPLVWATAILFRKTFRSQQLFELTTMVEQNYGYYRALYNIESQNFRNDCAFAIAHYVLNGYCCSQREFLPWPIITVPGVLDSLDLRGQSIVIRTPDRAYVSPRQSIHILSKTYLQSDDFRRFAEAALA